MAEPPPPATATEGAGPSAEGGIFSGDAPRGEEISVQRYTSDINEVKNIGSGSFGCAILVESKSTGERFVAKKISLEHLTPEEQQKALQEASLLKSFRHVNITEYLGSFVIGNTLHIIMEYCSGGSLQQAMKRRENANETFDEEEVFDWFLQIGMALEFVHQKRVLHRDIKTSNVFLTNRNLVKLGDFGIARQMDDTSDFAQTCNNLHELWALLNFLLPDVFSNSDDFDSWFDLSDKKVEEQVIGQLHKVLRPFLLRRVKTEVEASLPPKKELIVYTQLAGMQKDQYKNILKRDMDALYSSTSQTLTANKGRLMNLVMQLRKCCNHPYLFEGAEDKALDPFGDHIVTNSGKMRVLDKLLLKLMSQGSRCLIFSQMTRVLDLLEDYCVYRQRNGDPFTYCRIDGSTGGAERQDAIDAFNVKNSTVFLFLLSTRAGGLGINLQTADTVVIYDSDWNPQADLQAMDRAHRIGQKREVKVFRFVTVDSIEEKVVERAELKLQMDFAVIQQGRLAEKHKNLSKEEALAAVRYGADKVFRSENVDMTDEEVEQLIANAKDLTAERAQNANIEDKAKRDLLDFSDANVNFQEFEGVDYKALAGHGDMQFMEMMQDSMGKRERSGTSYKEGDFYRDRGASSGPVDKSLPKMKKVPEMRDFQLFNQAQIIGLYEKEHQADLKRAKAIQRAAESGAADATVDKSLTELTDAEIKDKEELTRLEAEGFTDWSRSEFTKFTKACERHGRDNFKEIAAEVGTKSDAEVQTYSAAFWDKGALYIQDFDKVQRRIEDGERKIKEKEKMTETLAQKVRSCDNPWQTLTIKYGNNRGKLFTEDEDRFLVCMTNELGYGKWDELKREVRRCPDFRFDWLFKSRTPAEIGRRVDLLVRLIANESKDQGGRKRKVSEGGAAPMEE